MKKLSLVLAVLIMFSCTKETIENHGGPIVRNGALDFKNTSQIHDYFKSKIEKTSSTSAAVEFVSFDDYYKDVLLQLDQTKTLEEHNLVLHKYKNIITLVDSTYVPKISNYLYRTICNPDRIYLAGGYAHKVVDENHIVISKPGFVNDLKEIESINNLDPNKFELFEYHAKSSDTLIGNERTQAVCGQSLQDEYFHNPGGCSSDRTVDVRAHTSFTAAGSFFTPHLISEAWGESRNWLCNWKQYKSKLTTKNSWIQVWMEIEHAGGDGIYFCNVFGDYYGTTNEYEHILFYGDLTGEIERTGGPTPTIQLYRIHEEANSNGVGATNWAIINCTWATILNCP